MNTKKNVTDSKIGHIIWLREADLNHRPSGYEPDELTRLLHPAMGYLKGQGYILLA